MVDPRRSGPSQTGLLGVGRVSLRALLHGNDVVFALLVVDIFHSQQHFVFLDAELGFFAHGQENGMLVVAGSNTVDHAVALQKIFLTEQSFALLMG
jgi:hypothetical protein